MSKNRFAGLQAVKQLQENKNTEPKITVAEKSTSQSPASFVSSAKQSANSVIKKPGRPRGKRSDTEFQQVTAYIRRNTYRKVSIKLLDRQTKGEFSELIEELLKKWLQE